MQDICPESISFVWGAWLLRRGAAMEDRQEVAVETGRPDRLDNFDFNFLPSNLVTQCHSLIESYHEVHGFACLPDILWKSRLGPFIERHRELRQSLRKASTTRSAKKSRAGFVR